MQKPNTHVPITKSTLSIKIAAVVGTLVVAGVLGFVMYAIWRPLYLYHVYYAAEKGDVSEIQKYFYLGGYPHPNYFDSVFRTSIRSAHKPYDNYIRIENMFIEHGADPNVALQLAVEKDKLEIAQVAIDKGADVNKRFPDGYTPLSLAKSGNVDPAMVKLLKHARAKEN